MLFPILLSYTHTELVS